MKCYCEECQGGGTITCPECDGQGMYHGSIQDLRIHRGMHNYEELIEFKKDAERVIRQASQLKELRPDRSESYEAQLRATLFVINAQAERAAEKDSPVHTGLRSSNGIRAFNRK